MARTRGAKSSFPSSRTRASSKTPSKAPHPSLRDHCAPHLQLRSIKSPPLRYPSQLIYRARRASYKVSVVSTTLSLGRLPAAFRFSDPPITPELIIRRPCSLRLGLSTLSSVLTWPLSDFSPSSGTPSICSGDPSVIHFTIDGRHGILGARHIAEALRIPYEPARPEDYRVWTNPSPSDIVRILSRGASTGQYLQRKELPPSMFFIDALLRHNIFPLQHWVQRRGALLEALFRISEGFFFGPHHLIMAALLYFEEKVHQKKLLRADAIPLLFPRLLCQILEHLGYPTEPQFERKRICREIFTLDKWTNMTAEPEPYWSRARSHTHRDTGDTRALALQVPSDPTTPQPFLFFQLHHNLLFRAEDYHIHFEYRALCHTLRH
ncbi:hypothetical protein AAG906_031236 [Vitis piasezkii]